MSRRIACRTAAALIGLAAAAYAPAYAHITAQPDSAAAGAYFETALMVPHGCGGSPTTALRVKIPDGVTGVKPKLKPGWAITIKTRELAQPIKSEHGKLVEETVDEIDWRGGPLPDNEYDSFPLLMKLPATPGATLYFPTVQECETDANRWIEIPAAGQHWHDLRGPAPFVGLKPATP